MPTKIDTNVLANRLALALMRLRMRRREVSSTELSMTQQSIMHRLRLKGPSTAAGLATAEHVSQQAIAQSIAPLKAAGLIQITPDASDGRKNLINITKAGQILRESIIASRNAWLAQAITATIDDDEQAVLDKAVELLERIAGAQ